MRYGGYPRYVSVAEKKEIAARKLKQLKKKMPDIKPVVITGKSLALTWWGKTWNKNLERYADFSNRIGRGRSYVRHGAVLDLKIDRGKVTALVQGSTSNPYEIDIKIKSISNKSWQTIKRQCEGELESLQDLLNGKFPKSLQDIFFADGKGLFPCPKEISFACSCPDWAVMCKHIAAVLYGIGVRFDEDPALFFKLRGVNSTQLISKAIHAKAGNLLAKTKNKSGKVIANANLSEMFGIDMANKPNFSGKKMALKKTANTPKTATGLVAQLVSADKNGVSINFLVQQTGFTKSKLYGIVHRLKAQGKIKNKFFGVYVKA